VFDVDFLTDYLDVFHQVKMRGFDRHLGKNRLVADSEKKKKTLSRLSGALSWELERFCTAVFTEVQNIIMPV
jgi:hypothetical protein